MPAPKTPPSPSVSPDLPSGTLGQKVCIALALVLLAGLALGVGGLWRWLRRPLPVVPPLPPAPDGIARLSEVRVVLARSQAGFAVRCPDGGTWYGRSEAGERLVAVGRGPWLVAPSESGPSLNAEPQPEAELVLYPNEGSFRLGDDDYRGSLVVTRQPAQADKQAAQLLAVNVLEPEQYLRGVVAAEMYSSWPLEALMAQAVAARTFMYHSLGAKSRLTRTDMAYRGQSAEKRSTDLAVSLTEGIILTWEDKVLPAYFSSTCGGHTAAVEKVFASGPLPPLAGVPCDWCRSSPWFEWQARVPASLLAGLVRDRDVQTVQYLVPEDTEPDGYARYVLINDEVRVGAGAFRLKVGGEVLKSACFDVRKADDDFVFEGRGYGHGVGLCQWGAKGQARDGRTWQEILEHYYPGAELRKMR